MRVAFVTNLCPRYRIRSFETLSRYNNVSYSADDALWYRLDID